jgi:56kDa selenium binding protein (SBP56)
MPMWRPDPTFYPSPKMAMQAPAEKLAFVAMLNAKDNGRPDALGVVDVDPSSTGTAISLARWTCRMPGTNCIISDGTRAALACARTLHIRT